MKRLEEILKRLALSRTDFARRIGHDNGGLVTQIVKGRRKLPIEQLDQWADALRLDGDERAAFIREVEDLHTPRRVLLRIQRLEIENATLHKLINDKLGGMKKHDGPRVPTFPEAKNVPVAVG